MADEKGIYWFEYLTQNGAALDSFFDYLDSCEDAAIEHALDANTIEDLKGFKHLVDVYRTWRSQAEQILRGQKEEK